MVQVLVVGSLFRWNLSRNVGRTQPNILDDVELVRFGYYCMSLNPKSGIRSKMKAELDAMKPAGAYAADLQKVIDAHQKLRGGTQDGHVSVGRGNITNTEFYDGKHSWIIAGLNNHMVDICRDIYPRIDKHLQSGPEITRKVKEILIGV